MKKNKIIITILILALCSCALYYSVYPDNETCSACDEQVSPPVAVVVDCHCDSIMNRWTTVNLDVDIARVDNNDNGVCDSGDVFVWDNGEYGKLYSWEAAMIACPAGWHLPTTAEWQELIDCLGGNRVAGGKMKSTTGWSVPNKGATDCCGFSALPGGVCNSDGSHNDQGDYGFWWTSTPNGSTSAHARWMAYGLIPLMNHNDYRNNGFSVRCVKN